MKKLFKEVHNVKNLDFLYGETTIEGRQQIIQRFESPQNGENRVLILSKKAGGVDIDLKNNGKEAYFLTPDFSPAVDDQAKDRINRVSSIKEFVDVFFFNNQTALESNLKFTIKKKRKIIDFLFNDSPMNHSKALDEQERYQLMKEFLKTALRQQSIEDYKKYQTLDVKALRDKLCELAAADVQFKRVAKKFLPKLEKVVAMENLANARSEMSVEPPAKKQKTKDDEMVAWEEFEEELMKVEPREKESNKGKEPVE